MSEPPNKKAAGALNDLLRTCDTSALMVAQGGRAIFSYGDIAATSYLASARKSIVSILYGPAVARREIDIDVTLRSISFDDDGGLLPIEKEARIRDLLAARSGIYHRAANLGDASDRAPPRGSVQPGSHFLYNNWDFNALAAVYEHLTQRDLYRSFELDIAQSIGLQDWKVELQQTRNDTGASRHVAHHFVLSTRDMARLGLLMLRLGRWGHTQVLTEEWVRQTTSLVTSANEVARTSPFVRGLGYGCLWWIFDRANDWDPRFDGAFTATGAFGQFITVVPKLDMAIAHKTQAPSTRNVTAEMYLFQILPACMILVT